MPTPEAPRAILFTDLDGTLLDHDTYQPGPAAVAVERLVRAEIPVVFCSAKTVAEQRALARALGVHPGLIAENGAAVSLPPGFAGLASGVERTFGLRYEEVRGAIAEVAESLGCSVRGYGDMSRAEVAAVTGLDLDAARRAMDRCCTETLVELVGADPESFARSLEARGLRLQRGARFWTVQGPHDKGRAVRWVETWLRDRGTTPTTCGVGDADNDLEMLAAVDHPFLVRRPDGSWADLRLPRLRRLSGIGPAGFAEAVEVILAEVSGP